MTQPPRIFSILSAFQQVEFYESLAAPLGKAFQEPRPILLIYRQIHFNIYLHEYFLLGVKNNITKQVRGARLRAGDDQKGKLCTAGRKIIALPQVKNIVALLKSACKPGYIIRMFKY